MNEAKVVIIPRCGPDGGEVFTAILEHNNRDQDTFVDRKTAKQLRFIRDQFDAAAREAERYEASQMV